MHAFSCMAETLALSAESQEAPRVSNVDMCSSIALALLHM